MNKKKACIESLAAIESNEEPPHKIICKESSPLNDDVRTSYENPLKNIENSSQGDPSQKAYSGKSKGINQNSWLSERENLMNSSFLSDNIKNDVSRAFSSSNEYVDDIACVSMFSKPFKHCVLSKLITDDKYIADLESFLLDLPMKEKNNDLYKFLQSKDLCQSKNSAISAFRYILEIISGYIRDVTGIPLNSKIDLFCSQYKYTDVLLCHDDQLDSRRVAFIYYLVPPAWAAGDGGSLDLFDVDDEGEPRNIVKSLTPQRNNFVFFEVSTKSFHQVSEVLSQSSTRLSLSGWFHGPPLPCPAPRPPQSLPALPHGGIEEEIFYSWFNPLYLAPDVQQEIRQRFEEDSEIELEDFLQREKYEELSEALKSSSMKWKMEGPWNKKHYYMAEQNSFPPILLEYLRVIHSDAVFLVLSNLTGLQLHSLAPGDSSDQSSASGASSSTSQNKSASNSPTCRSEVRRWDHGCYSLADDSAALTADFALDSMLYLGCGQDWSMDNGGYTSYIAKGEDEELLSVGPKENSLALVYRDAGSLTFVKHVNHAATSRSPHSGFYEINAVYYE